MFIAALFIIAKLWNQTRYLTTDEWIKEILHTHTHTHTHTMEYYSAIKKNEILPFAGRWMGPEIITLSKILPPQKAFLSSLPPSYFLPSFLPSLPPFLPFFLPSIAPVTVGAMWFNGYNLG
jgi:hypothetical protein